MGVRIDKWLWAARFFKSRSLAAKACELGRIEIAGNQVKASRDVHVDELVRIRNDSGDFHVLVLVLSDVRGPATVAQTLYRETEKSREARLRFAEQQRTIRQFEAIPDVKPSKRDRRKLDRLRGRA